VLCELLTDLNGKNFLIKKNALNRIFENNIIIDWEQPHKKHFESFYFFNVKYNLRKDNILLIYDTMKNSNDLNDFENKIIGLREEYEIIQKYDKAFDSYFRKEMDIKNTDFRKVFSYSEGIDICNRLIEYLKSTEEGFQNFRIAMCTKMAEDLYDSPLNMYKKRTVKEIANSYNSNIDVFLIISGIYALTKVSRNEQISRNDFNDLYHLMYINDAIIVSDDNIFSKYMKDIYPDKIISCNDLKKCIK
jgi:hypothetical protein